MSKLTISNTVTHCPSKGDSTYYSLPDIVDVGWSYKVPIGDMDTTAGQLAFDEKLCNGACGMTSAIDPKRTFQKILVGVKILGI
ncbi:hypothetical protein A8U91_02244 [Halomonas elongata]|uniref:DUF427 domain-containing protein n=1 Tax=Halomonas elongata TaxID=2746 RepID=A0A1B8P6G7_HALEL|nr:hypothetical protein A8U91_02244 [Halomonas elongata]